ncbi:MAG: sulfatase-like hydrolase/transferase [Rhodobacterales bacterium]|nr:sulfatase-like hydrolase/transferase [Rhodobacterales bacterium]
MKFARNAIQGATGGIIAGATIGLIEAVYLLVNTGRPDLLAPLYGVVMYGFLGLALGLVASVLVTPVGKFKPYDEGVAWGIGACGAVTPMGLLILKSYVNTTLYLDQGIPTSGMVGIYVVVGVADLLMLTVVAKIVQGPAKAMLAAKGLLGLWGAMIGTTAAINAIPLGQSAHGEWAHDKAVPTGFSERPNVLIIQVDSLRADALGAYGSEGNPTPVLDALAADAVLFEQGFAQASSTRSSTASLITSTLPAVHGADVASAPLSMDRVTWAEHLRAQGYATASLVNHPGFTGQSNFDQGSESYVYETPNYAFHASQSASALVLYKTVLDLHGWVLDGPKDVHAYYQPAARVLDDAKRFISANQQGRWGLFVQLMEPQAPYFEHPVMSVEGGADYNGAAIVQIQDQPKDDSPENIARLRKAYQTEVRFLDAQLAGFVQWLKDEDLYNNTLIVLTSNHGEAFYEHGVWGHGTSLHVEQTHIPIVVKLYGNELAGIRVPWLVRSIDIVPTVAAELGLPADSAWSGVDLIGDVRRWATPEPVEEAVVEGEDEALDVEDVVVSEEASADPLTATVDVAVLEAPADPCEAYFHTYGRVVQSEQHDHGVVHFSVREGGFAYLAVGQADGTTTEFLYDLVEDAAEVENLVGNEGARCGVHFVNVLETRQNER